MPVTQRLQQIRQGLVEAGVPVEERSASEIAVRAVHPDVGDLVISSDALEITVAIGGHFHRHFANDEFADAARFALEFVTGRSVLTVKYRNSQAMTARVRGLDTGATSMIGCTTQHRRWWLWLGELFSGRRERTQSFTWTGPAAESDSLASPEDAELSQLAERLSVLSPNELKSLADSLSQHAAKPEGQSN